VGERAAIAGKIIREKVATPLASAWREREKLLLSPVRPPSRKSVPAIENKSSEGNVKLNHQQRKKMDEEVFSGVSRFIANFPLKVGQNYNRIYSEFSQNKSIVEEGIYISY